MGVHYKAIKIYNGQSSAQKKKLIIFFRMRDEEDEGEREVKRLKKQIRFWKKLFSLSSPEIW